MKVYPQLPIAGNGVPINTTPLTRPLARTYDATISSATDITLNAATTIIEVTALAQGIFMRYQATASSSNFDEFIPPNTSKLFGVPPGVTVVSFIQEAATAKLVVIEK